jgi:hypothetical protein
MFAIASRTAKKNVAQVVHLQVQALLDVGDAAEIYAHVFGGRGGRRPHAVNPEKDGGWGSGVRRRRGS